MNNAWEYNQLAFSLKNLTCVKGSFFENYQKIIFKEKTSIFVKCYLSDGTIVEKSFEQFDMDVRRAINVVTKNASLDTIVATKSDNNYYHLCYIMAILLSGRRLCLLNPMDSEADTQKKLNLLKEKTLLIEVGAVAGLPTAEEIAHPQRNILDDFIYVFTSGTTGDSKIVRQTEAGALSNLEALIKHHELDLDKKTIATPLPVFHVNALHFSFFSSFFSGSKLVLFQKFDPILLIKSIKEDHVEIVSVVPHILATLLNFEPKLKKLNPDSFKYFVSAATGLPTSTFRHWIDLGYKIIQGYGMSEGINFSLKTPIRLSLDKLKQITGTYERASVGIPIYGNEVTIFDELENPIESDETIGQIGIKGWNLMPGYKNLGNPPLNAFGFFKTGDLGFTRTIDSQKYFFISSRVKEIAKPMGVMVSLPSLDEKIKHVLGSHVELMTFSHEEIAIGERIGLVLVIQFRKDYAAVVLDLLKRSLLSHEIPTTIICTDRVIRSESGKLIRGLAKKMIEESQSEIIEGTVWHFPKKK